MDNKITINKAPGYLRDKKTGAIINTNTAEYDLILERRKHKEELNELKSEFDQLRRIVEKLSK